MNRTRNTVMIVLALALCAVGQSAKPKGPRSGDQIVVQEVVISGTTTLTSEELSDISNSLVAKTMRDEDDIPSEYLKYEFEQRGYVDADITDFKIVPLDPLAKKKPVRIEASVDEGQLFHLAEVKFTGNSAFSTAELLQNLPLRPGDVFDVHKIEVGLQATLDHYLAKGFLEAGFPHEETRAGAGLIMLTFNVDEGIQYRMGQLRIEGKGEATDKLRGNWELNSGEPYDYWYLEKFLTKNRELFPEEFDNDRDVLWLRDCADNTINVTIELDPRRQWKPKPQDKPCEASKDKADKDKRDD